MAVDYAALIRAVPDFPRPGVLFRDVTPLFGDAEAFGAAVQALAEPFRDRGIDRVAAIEARGYPLGAPIALELSAGFVPVRKAGKLPLQTYSAAYALEYGEAAVEVHKDGLLEHHRVLLVDDVLATGGTMAATIDLVRQSGATVAGIAVLIELEELRGREKLSGYDVFTLIQY